MAIQCIHICKHIYFCVYKYFNILAVWAMCLLLREDLYQYHYIYLEENSWYGSVQQYTVLT